MKRVTGLGGVFFQCQDKEKMQAWYHTHLGIESEPYGHSFLWREDEEPTARGYTVWSPFAAESTHFHPSKRPFMFNYRVDDLAALLPILREEGVEVVGELEQHENGKFAWIMDPEGQKIELWEPIEHTQDPYLPPDDK